MQKTSTKMCKSVKELAWNLVKSLEILKSDQNLEILKSDKNLEILSKNRRFWNLVGDFVWLLTPRALPQEAIGKLVCNLIIILAPTIKLNDKSNAITAVFITTHNQVFLRGLGRS